MIPDIGMMIGAYIFVRCTSFLLRSGERKEHLVVKILAVVAIIVTLVSVVDLISSSSDATQALPNL